MAKEAARAFLQLVMEDEELCQRTADLKAEDAVEIAKEKGFVFTADEFTEAMNEERELDPDELEAAAGGRLRINMAAIWCNGKEENGRHHFALASHTEQTLFSKGFNIYRCTRCGYEKKRYIK